MTLKSLLIVCLLSAATVTTAAAQATQPTETKEAAYRRTVTERAAKIVTKLDGGLDAKKSEKVRDVIADQYVQLNDVHEKQKAQLAVLKTTTQDDASKAAAKTKVEAETTASLDKLHVQYLKKLSKYLTAAQVDQVKDGMTYGVLPITVKAYDDMLPNLTAEQKTQILTWLTEAREKAMDAGSSEQKHAWFGKYKGKINNYLSAAGINMNQAGKDWQARIAERKAAEAAK
jgi:Spy/CpxP family protein refolding chaperone